MEFKIVSNESAGMCGKNKLETMLNEAAADGWRYQGTMSSSKWGSTQAYAATVLMYRESVPKLARQIPRLAATE